MTLYWRPSPERVRGLRGPRTCLGQRPAALLPQETTTQEWAAFVADLRERERAHAEERAAWAQCLLMLARIHAEELAEAQAGHDAALEALRHSEALALEATAAGALERMMDALAVFEARARRDPAGAARALCAWLAKVSASGERRAA